MTPIHVPLQKVPSRFQRMRQSSPEAQALVAYDPCLDSQKIPMGRDTLLDGEHSIALFDPATSLWAGIHWYRQLPDRSQLESL